MFEFSIALVCLLGLYLLRKREPIVWPPVCKKCGTETQHYCGMGACVDMCPKCYVLR
jgi:hypothetical protein